MKRNMLSHRRDYITKRKNELLKEKKSLLRTTVTSLGPAPTKEVLDAKADEETPDTRLVWMSLEDSINHSK